jgi:hypothetical protein
VLREPIEREIGKIGRAVLASVLVLGAASLLLALVAVVSLVVQRQLEGPPLQDHAALHTAHTRPSVRNLECGQPRNGGERACSRVICNY